MTSIFVAKLDYGITPEDLRSAFEQYGKVNKVTIATDKETGRSKGFAFVEMFQDEEAQEAIAGLDGSTMSGRQIAVKQAEDRSSGAGAPPRRDFSAEKRPYSPSGPAVREQEYKKLESTPEVRPENIIPADSFKLDPKKKEIKKKEKTKDLNDGRPRPHKMEAYKKSGKNNRFFGVDDDDEDF